MNNTIIFYVISFLIVLGFSQHIFELDGSTTYRVTVGLVLLFFFLHSSVVAYASWKRLKTDRTRVIGTGETIIVPIQSLPEQDN